MKKLSLFLVLLLAFLVMPSSSFALTKPAVAKKPAVKKVVVKKVVKSMPASEIKAVQTALSKQGFYKGKVDGMVGKMTTNAVKAFQKKKGLKVDGLIGPKTLKALGVTK